MHEPHILGRKSGRYKWRCCLSFPWDKITYTIASFKHLGKMSAIFQESGSSVTLLGETSSGSPYRVVSQPRADTPVAQVAAHCPAVPAPPSRTCCLEEVEPASPPLLPTHHPRGSRYLEVPSVQGRGQMLADLGQLGPGASGTGPLPQGVFLQVLFQLRLPEEEFCHVICKGHSEKPNWNKERSVRGAPPPRTSGPSSRECCSLAKNVPEYVHERVVVQALSPPSVPYLLN